MILITNHIKQIISLNIDVSSITIGFSYCIQIIYAITIIYNTNLNTIYTRVRVLMNYIFL